MSSAISGVAGLKRISLVVDGEYSKPYHGIMKTTVDINRRKRMVELIKHAGTCKDLVGVEKLLQQRRKD
jgi:hypothetical protein